jgi:outer membrane biogenesis lipoprotein LolB
MKRTLFVLVACASILLAACNKSDTNPVGSTDQTGAPQVTKTTDMTPASSGSSNGETRVEGKVTAVDPASGRLTIRTTVIQTDASTKIERNGVRVPLSSIQVGDRGQARIPAGSTIASKVESVG